MRIAVVGGTGLLGSLVVRELESRGHDVRVLGRHVREFPVDLTTGSGLDDALVGCEVVVDASNSQSKARETLVDGCRRLLEAAHAAGVGQYVGISIVGCDAVPMPYYRVKVEQERVIEDGPVPWSIVRATQFHEFVDSLLSQATRRHVLPLLKVPVQTVAVAEVAALMADVAEAPPTGATTSIAGPRREQLDDLTRAWRDKDSRWAVPLRLRVPGKLGRALRAGGLTTAAPDASGRQTFHEWLAAR
ncbi:SDR family oxidoreductase [Cellulomonas rhizosphaerae]|uniref:NAD-dependent epimerase/dehydratase family protein n=1 Tax=Cellulomonas rhizosphaerae TaxID=2293719 RepID=A0A413RLP3_9CELL|nr:NAD(P)H-binding protein [Cellulomonas rhizosphaerae]RHA40994.1 NAD-dependent epimerase/dehydratase family protein [Cellulomonas rhizosphaerae]